MKDGSPISDLESGLIAKVCAARFPPYSASKRFARDLSAGYIKQLSPRGRRFLAYCVNRFRRQYQLTDSEWVWVREWLEWKPEPAPVLPEPLNTLVDSLPRVRL